MEQQINLSFMVMALGMQGITVPEPVALQIELTRKKVLEKGENFSIQDAVEIQNVVKEKFPQENPGQ